jgi:hypothetical protein
MARAFSVNFQFDVEVGPENHLLGADLKGLIEACPIPALILIHLFLFALRALLDAGFFSSGTESMCLLVALLLHVLNLLRLAHPQEPRFFDLPPLNSRSSLLNKRRGFPGERLQS